MQPLTEHVEPNEVYVVCRQGRYVSKARDGYGYVMGYCCEEGHDTIDEAKEHANELGKRGD